MNNLNLERRCKLTPDENRINEFIMFYVARSDEKPVRQEKDTDKLELFTVEEMDSMVKNGQKMSPILLMLFERYKENAV
jgi:hypothetical protein